MDKIIYHIVKQEDFDKWMDNEYYYSPTFDTEGFIHLSRDSQVDGVLDRYYKNVDGLIKLHVDTSHLINKLVYEAATAGELFPHLYGGLNKDAITHITVLS